MAYSKVSYTSDGVTALRTVPFPFLSRTHVTVAIDGTPTTNFVWLSDSQIQLNPIPANGAIITISRSTSPGAVLVDFVDGARLREADLDKLALQVFYLAQESIDAATAALALDVAGNLDMQSKRIVNLANAQNSSDAINLGQLQTLVTTFNGNVPPPANPGDNGKILTANAGTFSWSSSSGFLPLTGGTLVNGTTTQLNISATAGGYGELLIGPSAFQSRFLASSGSGEASIGTVTNHDFWLKSNGNFRVRVAADGKVCFGNSNAATFTAQAVVHSRGAASLNAMTWGAFSGSAVLLDGAVANNDHVFLDFRQNLSTLPMARIAMKYVDAGAGNANKQGSLVLNGGTYNGISATGGLTINHVGEVTVPTPTASGHAATKGYVDTAVATKAAANDSFAWETKFSGSSAAEFNLLSLYGPGIYRVTTGVGGKYVQIPSGNNAISAIASVGSGSATVSAADRVSAEDNITLIEKLKKS